jgi:septum formation protein
VPFRVVASVYDETPADGALANARGKAREVAARAGVPAGGAVLGSDTEVALDGKVLGKPRDVAEAREMLELLSGRVHEVRTAVVLITARGERAELDATQVVVRPLSDEALEWYLQRGEWRERAGGYAIQGAGAMLIERISGDYTTVVGLPMARLVDVMLEEGFSPWA